MTLDKTARSPSLINCVEDVAVQLALLSHRSRDKLLTASGWTLRHAADSNIVAFYLRPKDTAARGDHNRLGFGEVFRADSMQHKIALAAELSNFIWYGLQTNWPILLIPPIDQEVWSFVRQVNDLPTAGAPEIQRAEEIARRLKINGYKVSIEDLELLVSAALLDSRQDAVGARLAALLAKERILSVDMLDSFPVNDETFAQVLRPWHRLEDMADYATAKRNWLERFRRFGRQETPNSIRDAEALARLEIWNNGLKVANKRLLYITGDNSILRAAALYRLEPDKPDTFLDLFIRHPRCYLDEAGIFTKDEESVESWFRILIGGFVNYRDPINYSDLGQWGDGQFQLNETVQKTVEVVQHDEPDKASEILAKWSAYAGASTATAAAEVGYMEKLKLLPRWTLRT